MGGLAAVIDWDRPVVAHELDPMLALTPHRATGGTRRITFGHAALAETFFVGDAPDEPTVTRLGSLSIAGDLRLWDRGGLLNRAGGQVATSEMDDRRLILAAYRRAGIEFLDDVDGDFAFVIWDDHERVVIAVRDRFGAKPLYFERTATGIRFASEVKQLAATSVRTIEPSARPVAEHLTDQLVQTRSTFFEGIERLRPSTVLIVGPTGERERRYWNPSPDTVPLSLTKDPARAYRERLIASVHRRLVGVDVAVSHVTGGLDSSSLTAAAHMLADRNRLPPQLHTASAIFPGHPNDETAWISAIAAQQPFPHHDFVPRVETIERYEADMWESDTPRPTPIEGLWTGTIDFACSIGAELVLSGDGGDEVVDQSNLLPDLLRGGNLLRWAEGARSYSSWSHRRLDRVIAASLRASLPSGLRRKARSIMGRSALPAGSLIHPAFWRSLNAEPIDANPTDYGFSSLTQNLLFSYVQAPRLLQVLEHEEERHAHAGLAVSFPFLDRTVIEFVASIPTAFRPLDGRTKPLTRQGFAGYLPDTVLNRRTATYANGYLDGVIARLQPHFRDRFPSVSTAAARFLDDNAYTTELRSTAADPPRWGDGLLWNAWTLMSWLDQLGRYRSKSD